MTNEWRPHPGPQELALRQPGNTFEILYGGARGGGKTDAGITWLAYPADNPMYRGLVIRRNSSDLSDWIDRAQRMYRGHNASVGGNPTIIRFPSGARIYTGHLQDDKAFTKYQGHEYQRILIEELTQIPSEKRYKDLLSSCRSTVPDLPAQVFLTTNPGGVGHLWVKDRFVDPAPPGTRFYTDMERLAVFVPAKVDDNPTLIEADPNYVKLLDSYKESDPNKYKAWRLGLWDVYEGQVFNEWQPYKDGPYHVVDKIPQGLLEYCNIYIGFDWGYNDSASAHWIAVAPENEFGVRRCYVYREIYANEKTAEWWANTVADIIESEPIEAMVLPHDCFAHLGGGQTIASRFDDRGIPIVNADAKSHTAMLNRQSLLHDVLAEASDGLPYIQIMDTCRNLIRTLPALPYSETKPEEIDSKAEDHAYDSLSYGLYYITHGEGMILTPNQPVDKTRQTPYEGQPDQTIVGQGIDVQSILNQGNIGGRDWRDI